MSDPREHHIGTTFLRLLRLIPYVRALHQVSSRSKAIFNPGYYLACNPDVATSGIHPLLHFLVFGAFEGRKPNPLFDPEFYLRQYPEVARGQINPLGHYIKRGAAEGRSPHPLFAPEMEGPDIRSDSLQLFLEVLEKPPASVLYSWWLRQEGPLAPPLTEACPRFSILLVISRPRRNWLAEAIASVQAQSYPHWELCICSNGPNESLLGECLALATPSDQRIRVTHTAQEAQTPVTLNQAASLATGDYLVVLDQKDRLATDALQWLAARAPADFIYSDEDRLDAAGNRIQPLFKPDWSPDLLLSCMYIGRIVAVSRAAWANAGGFRPEHPHAWEYDLALRVTETTVSVQHVPRILYSRRDGEPTASQDDDMRHCLQNALRRRTISAEVEAGPRRCSFRVHRKPISVMPVSIIICSRSAQLLERCMASLEMQATDPYSEIIVVQHLAGKPGDLAAVIARHRARRLTHSGPFNFSRMNNRAAKVATGDVLVFLNDDVEVLDPSWLQRLVAHLERPDVGVAGARLLYPSNALQHGGVAVGIADGCGHIGRGVFSAAPQFPWLDLTRDVSAVTGACMVIRKSLFRELGGFAEVFPVNYNDIDLCLRVREAGYRVIYEAGAVLRHYECQSRCGVITAEERKDWYRRWGKAMEAEDPFYNPNLTRRREDLSFRSRSEACLKGRLRSTE